MRLFIKKDVPHYKVGLSDRLYTSNIQIFTDYNSIGTFSGITLKVERLQVAPYSIFARSILIIE
ncbi:hypothetical protein [Dyadobacter tibetensis]|uniref:hypothetical protein n=1 Tax=Dyadobacter tibetensis TaxID=1211851 RepID=UPI000472DF79|nr:hypothetical protein [Dyadobacter tibetensis]